MRSAHPVFLRSKKTRKQDFKYGYVSVILVVFCAGSSCRGMGELESCVGSFAGQYEGSEQGTAVGFLDFSGQVTIGMTFTDSDTGAERRAEVLGELEVGNTFVAARDADPSKASGLRVEGQFNFEDCSASGSWSAPGDRSGTFRIEEP